MKRFIGMLFKDCDGSIDLNEVAAFYEASSGNDTAKLSDALRGFDKKVSDPHTVVILKSGVKLTIRESLWNFRKDMEKYLKEEKKNDNN